jgi:hypothetical protein
MRLPRQTFLLLLEFFLGGNPAMPDLTAFTGQVKNISSLPCFDQAANGLTTLTVP